MKNTGVPQTDSRNFEISISKEQLSVLQAQKFEGEIQVIETEEDSIAALKELEEAEMVGFDTETKPAFKKGHINHVALLQLATPSKTYLFRICKIGLTEGIKNFLENQNQLKVGLSIKDDFHSLNKLRKVEPKGFIDLQEHVKKYGIADCSLTKIHAIVFGTRISKSQQLSNWEAQFLTQKQQEYAALDALACINIYRSLNSGDFKPSESPYTHICGKED